MQARATDHSAKSPRLPAGRARKGGAAVADPPAREFLRRADPILRELIDAHPDFHPRAWLDELPPLDAFGTLIFQVVGQQLSVTATRTIVSRLQERFGGRMPSPAELLAMDQRDLRSSGMSNRKGATLRALAERFVDGRLSDRSLARMSDDEIEAALTEVSGIGPWTAHGFLIVALDRPDVLLSGDLALRRAVAHAYGFDHQPTEDEMDQTGRAVAPLPQPRGQLPVRVRIRGRNLMQSPNDKSVGIIGAGHIGQVMARIARRAGRQVVIANREGPQTLAAVVQELGDGVSAGTVKHAAAADIVVLAVMWADVPHAVDGLAWEGRIVIDPTNDFDPSDLNGRTSSEVVADLVAPARVVKAGNTFAAAVLGSDPQEDGGQRVIFLSGDDADSKSQVGELFEDVGFFVVDLGGLREGGRIQQFGGPLAGHNLIRLP